jgi:hypothetical protein
MTTIRRARVTDALLLGPLVREADVAEVLAASGRSPEHALLEGIHASTHAWTFEVGGVPCAVFGVAPFLPDMGAPWLLASTEFRAHARRLLAEAPRFLDRMHRQYPLLCNFVDARNLPAIRFLRHVGFTLAPARPYGYAGLPFHRFTRVAPYV